jgi:hypothetical protein
MTRPMRHQFRSSTTAVAGAAVRIVAKGGVVILNIPRSVQAETSRKGIGLR